MLAESIESLQNREAIDELTAKFGLDSFIVKEFRKEFLEFLRRPLLRNLIWMLLTNTFRLTLQLVAFVLLVRILGPEDYGNFAAILAIALLIAPFIEMGGYSLIVRDITAGIPVNRALGNSLLLSTLVLPFGLVLFCFVKVLLLPDISWAVVFAIGFGQFIGIRIWVLVQGVHVAKGLIVRNAALEATNGIITLLSVAVLQFMGGTLNSWALLFFFNSFTIGAAALGWVYFTWGAPSAVCVEAKDRIRAGFYFAVGLASQSGYMEIDKAMLVRLASSEISGIYAAAYRFINVAFLPLNALLSALYPKFFQQGIKGSQASATLAYRVLPWTISYGLLVSLLLWLIAPIIPQLLGSDYSESVEILRWLALILLLHSFYFPLADSLTGSGLQEIRTQGQLGTLIINVILNAVLIPPFGWLGAVIATLTAQTFLLIFLLKRMRGLS